MLYRLESGKIQTQAVEYAAADHCNLRCAGCSHMSPFLRSRFSTEEAVARDLGRLATAMHAAEARILGGEPLLNPHIVSILRAAKSSGIADRVILSTNGLLLPSTTDEFWESVDEVRVSLYPGARPTDRVLRKASARARESGTELRITGYGHFRTTIVTEPHPSDSVTTMIFRTCKNAHLFHCHMVHAGRLYKCACPSYLNEFLASMGQSGYEPERDGFDIHGATDLSAQLWNFLSDTRPLDACRYCLGYVGKMQAHHQLTKDLVLIPRSRSITRKTHLSKSRLLKESIGYVYRRTAEAVSGRLRW
jgi:hypothetical protein